MSFQLQGLIVGSFIDYFNTEKIISPESSFFSSLIHLFTLFWGQIRRK